MSHEPFIDLKHDRAYQEMMKLFEEMSFRERMRRMFDGLSKPKDTGDYKFAKLQLERLSAPFLAAVVPIFVIVLMVAFGGQAQLSQRAVPTEIVTPETLELEEPPPPPEPPEFADPVDIDVTVDINLPQTVTTVQNQPMSPQPAEFDSVAIVKSPIVMRGIYGSRNPGARGQALRQHGGSAAGEAAVMRALRWFVKNQKPDGSWDKNKTAMTGLALLCFLAHGETPASEEFGPTVEKAIRYLVQSQDSGGLFAVKDGHNYSHPIAAYALCEAYTLTKVPMVKDAAERAMTHVVRGQNASGGWDYNMKINPARDDTSYMGWCAQAVKAAKMAEGLEIPGLEDAYKKSVDGFRKNAGQSGGFGYTGPGGGGLTSVGTLCMQLMGASASSEVQNSLGLMDEWVLSWDSPKPAGSPQYFFYYATQCMFHAGGERWKKWNAAMQPEYIKAQKITPKEQSGYVDNQGKPQEIGWWENIDTHSDRPVMDTALATLQLEVYYRYLPTFRTPEVVDQATVLNTEEDVPVVIQR